LAALSSSPKRGPRAAPVLTGRRRGPLARALGRLLQLLADDPQGQELVTLQPQDRAQPLDVLLRETGG